MGLLCPIMSSTPSLAGCILRIKRAWKYIKEAESLISSFSSECEERILRSYNADTGQYGTLNFPDAPEELPLAISDAVHNFRATADYLVYELALLDSGFIQSGTQFPIETYKDFTTANG